MSSATLLLLLSLLYSHMQTPGAFSTLSWWSCPSFSSPVAPRRTRGSSRLPKLISRSHEDTHGRPSSVVHSITSYAASSGVHNTTATLHTQMCAQICLQAHHAADAYPTDSPAASCIPEGRRSPQDHYCRLDEHRARPPGPGKGYTLLPVRGSNTLNHSLSYVNYLYLKCCLGGVAAYRVHCRIDLRCDGIPGRYHKAIPQLSPLPHPHS
jgi:hypothetical protein